MFEDTAYQGAVALRFSMVLLLVRLTYENTYQLRYLELTAAMTIENDVHTNLCIVLNLSAWILKLCIFYVRQGKFAKYEYIILYKLYLTLKAN